MLGVLLLSTRPGEVDKIGRNEQRDLADSIQVPYQRVNALTKCRRRMTPNTALRLAKYFGTSADFWMNLQLRWDLYHARREEEKKLSRIRPRAAVSA